MNEHRITREWALEMAARPNLNSGLRLFLTAIAESDSSGHARFAPNELASKLQIVNRFGEPVPMAGPNLYRAIQLAVANGLLLDCSSSRELVIPMEARA